MEDLIRQAFIHVELIGPHVVDGHYDLVGPSGEIILPQVWETVVEPDWTVTMHMWPMPEPPPPEPEPPAVEVVPDPVVVVPPPPTTRGRTVKPKKKQPAPTAMPAGVTVVKDGGPPPPPLPPGVAIAKPKGKPQPLPKGIGWITGRPTSKSLKAERKPEGAASVHSSSANNDAAACALM